MRRRGASRACLRSLSCLVALSCGFVCRPALAKEPEDAQAPPSVTGEEHEAVHEGDGTREVFDTMLWLPRRFVDVAFLLSGVAAGLIEDEQLVPRVDQLLNPPHGEIHVFPTLFAETRVPFNVGARAVASAGRLGTSVRVGFGGSHDLVLESRLRVHTNPWLPAVISLEALHDIRSAEQYRGLGADPINDSRNTFVSNRTVGYYTEVRERFIASLGYRPFDGDFEAFFSTSLSQRRPFDTGDRGEEQLSRVFDVATVPGWGETGQVVYSELALRYDSRTSRQGLEPGFLAEVYGGNGVGINATSANYLRGGARATGFISLHRRTNVLSPKLVIDVLEPLDNLPVPFNFLLQQPDFRGPVYRTDEVSVVASLDYTWFLAQFMAARVFIDAATVSPRVAQLSIDTLNYALGFGADFFGDDSLIGSTSFSFNGDGVRFTLRIGLAPIFGDRQHRQ